LFPRAEPGLSFSQLPGIHAANCFSDKLAEGQSRGLGDLRADVFEPLAYCFYWLGLTIGMDAFPSARDFSHLWHQAPAVAKKGSVLALIRLPLAGVLVILNYARVIWVVLDYGITVGILGPLAIFRALAR